MSKEYTDKQLNAATILLENNFTFTDICEVMKTDRSRFARFLEQNGIRDYQVNNTVYDYNSDFCISILNDYNNGMQRKEIMKKYNIHDGLLYRILDYYNCNLQGIQREYTLNEYFFNVIDTEEKAYWLGFLYADGYVYNGPKRYAVELTLKEDDEQHIINFMNIINYNGPIIHKVVTLNDRKYKASRINICSKKFSQSLVDKGCVQNKSLILKFPDIKIVPKDLQRHFMRGYFDGDGSVSVSSGQLHLSVMGTNDFLNKYMEILNDNGTNKKDIKSTKSKAFVINYGGNKQIKHIYNFFYDNSTVYLKRKYERFIAVYGQNS